MASPVQWNPYAFVPGACVAIGAVVAALAYRRRDRVRGAREFGVVSLLILAFCLGEALALSAATLEGQQWGVTLFYLTFPFIPVTGLRLALAVSGREAWLTRGRTIALFLPPILFVLAFLTNGWHHGVVSEPTLVHRAGFVMRSVETKPLFFVFTIYSYVVIAGLAVTYGALLFHGSPSGQRQAALLLFGTVAPWCANLAYMFGLNLDPLLDLTPCGYAVALIAWAWALFRGGILDLAPVARAAVFDLMKDPVLVVDDWGRVVDVNAALLALCPAPFAELVGRPRAELPGFGASSPDIDVAGRTYTLTESEVPFKSPLGAADSGRIVVFHDVTEDRRAQAAERDAREAAQALAATRADFLARTTHEVRTPLYGVLGTADLLLRTDLDAQQRKLAETLRRSGKNLLEIVDDVLDFVKLDAKKVVVDAEDFDVTALLLDVQALFEGVARGKGLELSVTAPAISERVRGDLRRTRQILTNLVANAVKFTHEGSVTLGLEVTRAPGPRARFTVADTGIGIPEGAREVVLEAFRQGDESTSRRYGGTGLGLSIAHELTELLSGTLRITSEPGRGSVFVVDIPYGACPSIEPPLPAPPRASGAKRRALVVDDHEVGRAVTTALLEASGCEVIGAASGDQAIEEVRRGGLDLVIMDLRMPDVDGVEVVRRLRSQGDSTKIVMFSAEAGAAVRWPSDLPAVPWVLKGDPDHLLRHLGMTELRPLAPSRELLDAFERSSELEASSLKRAVADGDSPEIRRLLHDLEGISRMVGASRTWRYCEELRAADVIGEGAVVRLDRARQNDVEALRLTLRPEDAR